jgi:hypothetical protein
MIETSTTTVPPTHESEQRSILFELYVLFLYRSMSKTFAQTVFGRRGGSAGLEQDAQEAKRIKEQTLVGEFPAEEDIQGDIVLDLLMMNG